MEKALLEDHDGAYLRDLQNSLHDFVQAVERHTKSGLGMDAFTKWRDLQKAAETAAEMAEELRDRLRDPIQAG